MPRFAVTVDDNGVQKRVVLESDTQPTEADVLSALRSSAQSSIQPSAEQAPQVGSQQQLQKAVQEAGQVGQRQLMTGAFMPSVEPEKLRKTATEAVTQFPLTAMRVLPATAATVATGGLGAIPAAAAIGGAGMLGETAAQAAELGFGKREKIEPGKVVESGLLAGTPILRPIAGAAGPVAAGIVQAGKQAGINALMAAFGKAAEKAIDQGRLPSQEEILSSIEVPALIGGLTGGTSGALARAQQPLTTAQQEAQLGREAAQRIEQQVGEGAAPLTAAQQTGVSLPGQFGPSSSGLATQQNLVQRIRSALNLNPQQERAVGEAVQAELGTAEDVSRQALRGQMQAGQTAAQAEVESTLRSIIPRSRQTSSVQESANNAITAIRQEENRLSGIVDSEFKKVRTALANKLAGQPETPVVPSQALTQTIDDLLGTLATEQKTIVTPSQIIGGQPTVTTVRIPSQFFNEATRRAEALKEVAKSPQTMDQLIGLRQSIDGLINYFNEFAPGVGQRQLKQLRSALKSEELSSARRLGVENELVAAQNAAEKRFNLLQENPIIRKAVSTAAEGGFQNTENFYSQLVSQPEAIPSISNLLSQTAVGRIQLDQIRRGLFDSLRSSQPIEIAGRQFENSQTLLNGFKNLPESAQLFIAGNKQNANQLKSILEDANRVQNVRRTIPVSGDVSQNALNEVADNLGYINSPRLRQIVIQDAKAAKDRSEKFFNNTTREVQNNKLNPDVDPRQFVNDFVFRSESPSVVQNALNQLTSKTRQAVQKDAATALLNHVSETAPQNLKKGAQSVEDILQDPNRLQVIQEVLDPADFQMINDYMLWTRARNLTQQGGRLQPNQLADAVMRVSRARWVVDSLVGNPAAQNFLASVARVPRIIGGLKPNLNAQQAEALARGSNVTLQGLYRSWDDLKDKSDKARESLPEDKREIFDETLAIPARPQ